MLSTIDKKHIVLVLILLLALFLRFYRVSSVPPSLSWDEASIGYDAYSIVATGKDQWGKTLPIMFKSFGEYKYPFHIYATAFSVFLLGNSTLSIRLPSIIFGVINIYLYFYLIKRFTNNHQLALVSSLFLAISPWHIHFSRINWETNFTLALFLLGLIFLVKCLDKSIYIILALFLLGLSMFTYNAPKIFVPLFVIFFSFTYLKAFIKNVKFFLAGIIIFIFFIAVQLAIPQLSGRYRFQQVFFQKGEIEKTQAYELTGNYQLGLAQLLSVQYLLHFSPEFLFLSGDPNLRHSSQSSGEVFWLDLLFVPVGIWSLLRLKKAFGIIFLGWLAMGPLPAAIAREAPHASRAMFMLASLPFISAYGLFALFRLIKTDKLKRFLLFITFMGYTYLVISYFVNYHFLYPTISSRYWQFGYQEIFLKYRKNFPDFKNIYISDKEGQPYIFALEYLTYNPIDFRREAVYNPSDRWGASLVKKFGKFHFGIDEKTFLQNNSLIFASPSEKNELIRESSTINNLDGSLAFYVYEIP